MGEKYLVFLFLIISTLSLSACQTITSANVEIEEIVEKEAEIEKENINIDEPKEEKIIEEEKIISDKVEIKDEKKSVNKPVNKPETKNTEDIKEPKEIVNKTGRAPNEAGEIMVIMYHHVVTGNSNKSLERTVKDFNEDLKLLYEKDYRLVSLNDVIDNNIDIEKGYTPVVITFDDGWSTAFSLKDVDGELVADENSGVGLINEFAEENPDFGKSASFFVNGYLEPFMGAGTLEERFNYLIENGYDIGNHTYSHSNLQYGNPESIQNEIVSLDLYVKHIVPDYEIKSIAYPYGARPRTENMEFALKGEYAESTYEYDWALRAGPSNASANPNNIKFDKYNIPRLRGSGDARMDFRWFLNYYDENPNLRYVSDGDLDTISVPKEKEKIINHDNLGDKELKLY